MMMGINYQALDVRFNAHPVDDDGGGRLEAVRGAMRRAAVTVAESVPEGREHSLALTKLEEAMFWANAGIAREGE